MSRNTIFAFAGCALLLGAIKLLFDLYPGDFPVKGQAAAFTWPLVLGVVLVAGLGLLAERPMRTPDRFPEPFSDAGRERRSWLIAASTGLAYGLMTIAQDLSAPGSGNPLNLVEWAHVPFPWSLPFYTFGAIFLEFLLRLGALCILVWLIHIVLLRRRGFTATFWTVNLVVASYEILPAAMESARAGQWLHVALSPLEPLYWTNVFEGWLLLRYGWVSPIVFRLAFYLAWHVIYGGFGPY